MSFEQHFKGFCEVTYSHFSILGFLMNFHDFRVFVFGYRAQNENSEITEYLYFLFYNTPMHVICVLTTILTVCVLKLT